MKVVREKIPTVFLITGETWKTDRYHRFEELYHPPLHEYCSLPVSKDELIIRLQKVIEAALAK